MRAFERNDHKRKEKNDRIGGLLRYGIPDFKMDKSHIDRRMKQLEAEGVKVRTGVMVGELPKGSKVTNWAKETISPEQLRKEFDAVLVPGGTIDYLGNVDDDGNPAVLVYSFDRLAVAVIPGEPMAQSHHHRQLLRRREMGELPKHDLAGPSCR